jgi:predicted methyltransferase
MTAARLRPIALLSLLAACASPPPPSTPTSAAQPPAAAALPSAATPPPAPVASPSPAEPTAEDKKKAEEARELQEDRAKWDEENKTELARWTPELHAEAKSLADKTYATGKAALQAAVKSKARRPADAERDKYRHPVATLEFFGFKPTMTVLDIGPGEGWYTEILAPALAKSGAYVATTNDPNGPPDLRATFYGQRFRSFLERSSELYGKVQTVVVDPKAPKLGKEDAFDMVLIMRGVHGMKNSGTLDAWLAEIHRALKPGGVLGIEEHRAPADADPSVSAKKGYVPEKWLIEQVEGSGFKLSGKSEINANPKDTKDYPEGVWTLPPTFRLGEKDRDKYAAIGESDRMTLRFVKASAKDAKNATKEAATKEGKEGKEGKGARGTDGGKGPGQTKAPEPAAK